MTVSSQVIQVYAVDDDEGAAGTVTYSITASPDCSNCFAIDPNDGWVTTTNSVPAAVIIISSLTCNNPISCQVLLLVSLFIVDVCDDRSDSDRRWSFASLFHCDRSSDADS